MPAVPTFLIRTLGLAAALALSAVMIFVGLGELALFNPDEGRNAEISREMHEGGRWLIPTYNDVPYLDKPALFFKLTGVSIGLLGTSEVAARLVSALFAGALLVLVFTFAWREYGLREASLSLVVVSTAPLFFVFSRLAIFDMCLAFFVSLAILCCYRAETRDEPAVRRRWYLVGAASAAVATLVKGPIGFVLPTLVVLAYNALEGRFRAFVRFFAPLNVLVFFALVLPWFLGVVYLVPDFAYYGLVKESLQRVATAEFGRTQPFYYYLPLILGTFFAWSLVLPESAARALAARRRLTSADRLMIVWAIVIVGFFSLPQSKMPAYVLTAIIALGVLTARLFATALAEPAGGAAGTVRRATAALLACCFLLAVATVYLRVDQGPLALLIKADDSPLLARVTDSLLPTAAVLAGLSAVAFAALRKRSPLLSALVFAATPLLLLASNFPILKAYAEQRSHRPLAERLASLPDETELACFQCLPHGVPFYLGRTMTVLTADGHEFKSNYVRYALAKADAWPDGVVRLSEAEVWLASRRRPVYLLVDRHRIADLETVAGLPTAGLETLAQGYLGVLIDPRQASP